MHLVRGESFWQWEDPLPGQQRRPRIQPGKAFLFTLKWNSVTSSFSQSQLSNCYRASNTFALTQCGQDSQSACFICQIGYYLSAGACVANATLYYANFIVNTYYSAGYGQNLQNGQYQITYTQCSTATQFI